MKKIIPVAIAIIHKNNTFLLTERKGNESHEKHFGPIWHFPGGVVEFGEEVQTALIREIKEELSVDILIENQVPHIFSAVRTNWHGLLIPYVCSIKGSEQIALDEESLNYGWFTYEEIKKLYTLPLAMEMLDEALRVLTPLK